MRAGIYFVFLLELARLALAKGPYARHYEERFGMTVMTSSGPIVGHAAGNVSGVSEYLGIPYAQAPLGSLRFAAPQRYVSTDLFDAAAFTDNALLVLVPWLPSECEQDATDARSQRYNRSSRAFRVFVGQADSPESEDCLTLNVWTKPTRKRHRQRKPVLVWIHGGRFNIGSSSNLFYQGQYLADQEDVVVVTMNYRLNIFGFSGAPAEPQNVGLLDQRMAVQWVRDNIAGFGGDPRSITLFGQSAGGASVDYYSFAWLHDPIVSGLISHSGTALSFVPDSREQSTAAFYRVSSIVGCGDSGDVLACMRSKDFRDILDATRLVPAAPGPALAQPVFHPTVDNKTVFADYEPLAAGGKFIQAPYLAGNTDYEAGFYKLIASATGVKLTEDQWELFNLAGCTCPTARTVEYRVGRGLSAWRYRCFGEWPNLRLYPGSGAWHGSELPLLFGTAEDISLQPNMPTQEAVSHYIMKAWATFAKNPQAGLTSLGWPEYDPEDETLIRLGFEDEAQASFASPAPFDVGCDVVGNNSSFAQGAF